MNNLCAKNTEFLNARDLVEIDIFQMLMTRDHVEKNEFLRLCDEKSRELTRRFEQAEA